MSPLVQAVQPNFNYGLDARVVVTENERYSGIALVTNFCTISQRSWVRVPAFHHKELLLFLRNLDGDVIDE